MHRAAKSERRQGRCRRWRRTSLPILFRPSPRPSSRRLAPSPSPSLSLNLSLSLPMPKTPRCLLLDPPPKQARERLHPRPRPNHHQAQPLPRPLLPLPTPPLPSPPLPPRLKSARHPPFPPIRFRRPLPAQTFGQQTPVSPPFQSLPNPAPLSPLLIPPLPLSAPLTLALPLRSPCQLPWWRRRDRQARRAPCALLREPPRPREVKRVREAPQGPERRERQTRRARPPPRPPSPPRPRPAPRLLLPPAPNTCPAHLLLRPCSPAAPRPNSLQPHCRPARAWAPTRLPRRVLHQTLSRRVTGGVRWRGRHPAACLPPPHRPPSLCNPSRRHRSAPCARQPSTRRGRRRKVFIPSSRASRPLEAPTIGAAFGQGRPTPVRI